jgi:hypothetical protein
LQNCFDLNDSVTSTTPGMCLGGVWTRMACDVINYAIKRSYFKKVLKTVKRSQIVLLDTVLQLQNDALTSLQTSIVPKTTCKPSKKLSPTITTVEPPEVHPSAGLMHLMVGVAGSAGYTPVPQSKHSH